MLSLSRGQKLKLAQLTSQTRLTARLEMSGALDFDLSCFGLDSNGQLSDDRYFVFFNQKNSPQNEVVLGSLDAKTARFELDLTRLPQSVRRLVFVATVDGNGAMNSLKTGRFALQTGATEVAEFAFAGADFGGEKAVMIAEIYFKDEWRVAANGQGFKDGLSAVLKHFGGQEIEETRPAEKPMVSKEEKTKSATERSEKITDTVPSLPSPGKSVSLQKNQKVSLSKMVPQGLQQIQMGLGWDPVQSGRRVDLDGSCIAFDSNKKVIETIWFGHLKSRDNTISHSGDNLTGHGSGDDEVIKVDLVRLAPEIQTLVFTVNSFGGQKFNTLKNTFCRVVNSKTNTELARYDLGSVGDVTGMIMAKVERKNGEWEMTAIGEPAGGITVHFLIRAVRKVI